MAGVGTQLFQPPTVLVNTMNGITQKYLQPVMADSIFNPSPTYWRLTRNGKKTAGGGSIVWSVITEEETAGGAYWGLQNLDTSAQDSMDPAELQWKHYYQNITIPETDIILNSGGGQVIDLVTAKTEIARNSLLQKLCRGFWGTAPQNTDEDIDGITEALAASGTYANITIGGNWICGGGTGPVAGTTLTLATMQSEYGSCTFGNEEPDTAITTQAVWDTYWGLLTSNQRLTKDDESTRGGFRNHLMFNNAVVLHDSFCPSGNLIMLTSKYVYPMFHERDYFTVYPFMARTNQRALVSKIYVTMNLVFYTLRNHARHTGHA